MSSLSYLGGLHKMLQKGEDTPPPLQPAKIFLLVSLQPMKVVLSYGSVPRIAWLLDHAGALGKIV